MDGLNFGGLLGGFGHGVGEDGDPANVRGATAEALGQFIGKALGEMVKPMVQDSVKTAVDLALREGFKQGVDEAYERMDLEKATRRRRRAVPRRWVQRVAVGRPRPCRSIPASRTTSTST